MPRARRILPALLLALLPLWARAQAAGAPLRAEVIHWWTSGGESAAVKSLATAYQQAGGQWIDTAVALGEQARSVAVNRIVGGNPPTVAQFNTSKQFLDLVEQGMLSPVDEVAAQQRWAEWLPEPITRAIRINGHYYAAPVSIHMPAWFWFSKSALQKAGVAGAPRSIDELFAVLDKLKAAGLIPLAHGGQAWQDAALFAALLVNHGGKPLFLKVYQARDPQTLLGEDLKRVLLAFRRLKDYTDKGSPGRNWNDATALVVQGKAGVQVIGDWAKAEFTLAGQKPGVDYFCLPGLRADAPYLIAGDVLVFPKSARPEVRQAQQLMARVVTTPATQVAFAQRKGSVPVRPDVDASALDPCAQAGLAILKDRSRQLGDVETHLTPDQNGAYMDVITAWWNRGGAVEKVQKDLLAALRP